MPVIANMGRQARTLLFFNFFDIQYFPLVGEKTVLCIFALVFDGIASIRRLEMAKAIAEIQRLRYPLGKTAQLLLEGSVGYGHLPST